MTNEEETQEAIREAFEADKIINEEEYIVEMELAQEFLREQEEGDRRFKVIMQQQHERHVMEAKEKLDKEAEILGETRVNEREWNLKVKQHEEKITKFHRLANKELNGQVEEWWRNHAEES